jgi:hypothetical protein
VLGQADAIAEQRAVRERRGRVDRQHRDLALGRAAQLDERADERRLARARGSGEADDRGVPGLGVDLAHELPPGGSSDSTSVIARASARLSPARSRWASESSAIAPRRLPFASMAFGHHTATGHRAAAARPRRARAAPRRARSSCCGWMRAHRMLRPNYARLLVRLAWLKLRFRGRLRTDGFAFVCPA